MAAAFPATFWVNDPVEELPFTNYFLVVTFVPSLSQRQRSHCGAEEIFCICICIQTNNTRYLYWNAPLPCWYRRESFIIMELLHKKIYPNNAFTIESSPKYILYGQKSLICLSTCFHLFYILSQKTFCPCFHLSNPPICSWCSYFTRYSLSSCCFTCLYCLLFLLLQHRNLTLAVSLPSEFIHSDTFANNWTNN